MKIIQTLFVVSGAIFFTACDNSGGGEPTPSPIDYEPLSITNRLIVEDRGTEVFRTSAEWSEFWALHPECNQDGWVAPVIDFDSDMVIATFWGLESNTGMDLSLRVESLERHGDVTTLILREQPPGERLPAFGYAELFLKLERSDGPVRIFGVRPM